MIIKFDLIQAIWRQYVIKPNWDNLLQTLKIFYGLFDSILILVGLKSFLVPEI